MKTKRMIVVIAIFVLCLLTLFSCAEQYEYNTDIDTNKPNGSFIKAVETYGEKLDDFVKMSDVIIIGEVVTDGVECTDDFYIDGDNPAEGSDFIDVVYTKIDVKIDEVLYGTVKEDTITVVQLGKPGINDAQMKMLKGDSVVLLLSYRSDEEVYCSVGSENCDFYILENGLYSYSNLPDIGKYDGTPPELLKRDINNILKSKEFKEYKETEVQ